MAVAGGEGIVECYALDETASSFAKWLTVVAVGFCSFWEFSALHDRAWGFAAAGIGFVGAWLLLCWRYRSQSVTLTTTAMIVQNMGTVRRIPKEEIRGFRIGRAALRQGSKTIFVEADTYYNVMLGAMESSWFSSVMLESVVVDLQRWLATSTADADHG